MLRELVRLARTPLRTTAEFINAHQIEGISSEENGLSWAARSRMYDAFQLAAILNGVYGLLSAKAARSAQTPLTSPKKALSQVDQRAARKVTVAMAMLARTPVKAIAEFIVAQGVSGVSFGESADMTQAAHTRLDAAFKKVRFLHRAATKVEALSAPPSCSRWMKKRKRNSTKAVPLGK